MPLDLSGLSRIEDAGLNASATPQQRWVDGWIVRFSAGTARRARCINAVATGRLPLAERLAECAQVYASVELPMIVRITPFSRPDHLDVLLENQGLHRLDDTVVMVLPDLGTLPPAPPGTAAIDAIGLETFAHRLGILRGSPLAHRQAHAQRLTNSPVAFHAFELRVDGQPVAYGQYAAEGRLVGLYDIYTVERARGGGWAGVLCHHLLRRARCAGATAAYLQVEERNLSALSVYRRLGFTEGYRYHYRTRDPSTA